LLRLFAPPISNFGADSAASRNRPLSQCKFSRVGYYRRLIESRRVPPGSAHASTIMSLGATMSAPAPGTGGRARQQF
jgi:hypothetical protein